MFVYLKLAFFKGNLIEVHAQMELYLEKNLNREPWFGKKSNSLIEKCTSDTFESHLQVVKTLWKDVVTSTKVQKLHLQKNLKREFQLNCLYY